MGFIRKAGQELAEQVSQNLTKKPSELPTTPNLPKNQPEVPQPTYEDAEVQGLLDDLTAGNVEIADDPLDESLIKDISEGRYIVEDFVEPEAFRNTDGFYSRAEDHLTRLPGKKPIKLDALKNRLQKGDQNVSKQEWEFLKMDQFIADQKAAGNTEISRSAVQNYIRERMGTVKTEIFGEGYGKPNPEVEQQAWEDFKNVYIEELVDRLPDEASGGVGGQPDQELLDSLIKYVQHEWDSRGRDFDSLPELWAEVEWHLSKYLSDEEIGGITDLIGERTEPMMEAMSATVDKLPHASHTHTLDGENYREYVTVADDVTPYGADDGIHMGTGTGGKAVSWSRVEDMFSPEGRKSFHVTEMQSKRHQDGSERGYIGEQDLPPERPAYSPEETERLLAEQFEAKDVTWEEGVRTYGADDHMRRHAEKVSEEQGVAIDKGKVRILIDKETGNVLSYGPAKLDTTPEEDILSAAKRSVEEAVAEEAKPAHTRLGLTMLGDKAASLMKPIVHEDIIRNKGLVPDAPFKKNWYMVEHKRNLMQAVKEGYDEYSWTASSHVPSKTADSKNFLELLYDKKSVDEVQKFINKIDPSVKVEESYVTRKVGQEFKPGPGFARELDDLADDLFNVQDEFQRGGAFPGSPEQDALFQRWDDLKDSVADLSQRLQMPEGYVVRIGQYDGKMRFILNTPDQQNALVSVDPKEFLESIGNLISTKGSGTRTKSWKIKLTPKLKEALQKGSPLALAPGYFDEEEQVA